MGLTYWLKMSASEIVKLKILKPFARRWYGRISRVYDTMTGVKAMLEKTKSVVDSFAIKMRRTRKPCRRGR